MDDKMIRDVFERALMLLQKETLSDDKIKAVIARTTRDMLNFMEDRVVVECSKNGFPAHSMIFLLTMTIGLSAGGLHKASIDASDECEIPRLIPADMEYEVNQVFAEAYYKASRGLPL